MKTRNNQSNADETLLNQSITRRSFVKRGAVASAATVFGVVATSYADEDSTLQPPVVPTLMSVTFTRNSPGGGFFSANGVQGETRPGTQEGCITQFERLLRQQVANGNWTMVETKQNCPYDKEPDTTGCIKIVSNPAIVIQRYREDFDHDGVVNGDETDGTWDWYLPNLAPTAKPGQDPADARVTVVITYCIGFK